MNLLTAALALVCAFSAQLCDTSRHVGYALVPSQYVVQLTRQPASMGAFDGRVIYVSSDFQQEGVVSMVLAHELTHASRNHVQGRDNCLFEEKLAYRAEKDQWAAIQQTFGTPQLPTIADTVTWMTTILYAPDTLAAMACG